MFCEIISSFFHLYFQLWLTKLGQSKALETPAASRSDTDHMLNMYGSNPTLLAQARQQHTSLNQQQIRQQSKTRQSNNKWMLHQTENLCVV